MYLTVKLQQLKNNKYNHITSVYFFKKKNLIIENYNGKLYNGSHTRIIPEYDFSAVGGDPNEKKYNTS